MKIFEAEWGPSSQFSYRFTDYRLLEDPQSESRSALWNTNLAFQRKWVDINRQTYNLDLSSVISHSF